MLCISALSPIALLAFHDSNLTDAMTYVITLMLSAIAHRQIVDEKAGGLAITTHYDTLFSQAIMLTMLQAMILVTLSLAVPDDFEHADAVTMALKIVFGVEELAVLYIVRFEWKRLSSHRNLQNGIARGLKSPVGDEGVPGIDFINTERAHAVDPCILNADEYSMVVKHRPTIQRIIDEVEALVSNDPSVTAARFPGFSKVAAKSYMSAALKTYYRATIPSDLLRVCVDCNVGDNDDDNSPEAIQKAITRAFVKFHKAQGKQERTPSGVGKWGQKPPKPLTEGVWLAQQKVLGHVREQGGEAKASQDLKTVFILRLPHNDAHDEVPIEIIVRRNPLTLAQHQIYKKKRLQTYMASTPHPASMWFVWKLWQVQRHVALADLGRKGAAGLGTGLGTGRCVHVYSESALGTYEYSCSSQSRSA